MHPLVSIIIPSYNSKAFLKESIASALNQTYKYVEVIVVDDGSTDGSLEIIRSFGEQIRWKSQPNQGAPVARNLGIKLARGEYIKFLDADDILLPDCLERQIDQALQLPQDHQAIVYGDALRIDQNGRILSSPPFRSRQPDQDSIAHILTHCPLTSCPLHKREYLLKIGGFDATLPREQEHDLHLRLVLAGVEFIYHPGFVYQYRQYSASDRISNHAFSKRGAMFHFEVLQKRKNLIEKQTDRSLTLETRKILARDFWKFGRGILREGFSAEANHYFEVARQLDAKNCATGNSLYLALVKVTNPRRAEAVSEQVKSFLGLKR